MNELDNYGRKLLDWLVEMLAKAKPGDVKTYVSYGDALQALHLSNKTGGTDGQYLDEHGLDSLAKWTKSMSLPGITGLIIDKRKKKPGLGYFAVFEKSPDGGEWRKWWTEEIRKSKEFDWLPYVSSEARSKLESIVWLSRPTPPLSPVSFDFDDPPPRVEAHVFRVLRDTVTARKVKELYDYRCQISGCTITFPDSFKYAESHHIQPLGKDPPGPDVPENILCVCPYHHVLLDYGVIALNIEDLHKVECHRVGTKYIDYHNNNLVRK